MSSMTCKFFSVVWLAIFLCCNTSAAAPACAEWNAVSKQSLNRLYSADKVYGRLGIKFGYSHVYLIEKSGCYDLSAKNLNTLKFAFNNAIDNDAQSEPVFLGVASIKTYAYRMGGYDQPVISAFFRNGNELDTSGEWALPNRSISDFPQGTPLVDTEITIQSEPYQPEADKSVASLDAVYSLINDANDALVRDWHALVVARSADGVHRVVKRNSYKTRSHWMFDVTKVNLLDGGVAIARNYLIKYRDSSSPTKKVFFTVENVGSAKCLYLKLVRPGMDGPLLGISEQSGDFVIFKLDPSAKC